MCVIVLKCKNTEQLVNTGKYLDNWGIKNHVYIDEGIFGCPPMTPTALATGILTEFQHWMLGGFKRF